MTDGGETAGGQVNLRKTLRAPAEFVAADLVPAARQAALARVGARYAVAAPPALVALIDPTDPADPIARQIIPDLRELDDHPAELADPIGDALKSPVKGLVHRYPDRVLLKIVAVCAVYCRFCFRREMVGPGEAAMSAAELAAALAYIRADENIWEVILTGGDPLMLSARRIAQVTRAIADIPHVKVLRWHTRLPVAAPERVTKAMAKALVAGHGKGVYVAVHANHPRELTPAARAACRRLAGQGVCLVSQSVLLRGVNDDADVLEALMRGFVEAGVKPYYLHHADLAPGTAHFRTTIAQGQALMAELRRRLSGLAMPNYVLDLPGAHGKVPLSAGHVEVTAPGVYLLTDVRGGAHAYRDACA